MPGLSTATITGVTGPAKTVTATVLSDVSRVDFQLANTQVLQVTQQPGMKIREFDLSATATLTATISSGVVTLTISQ